MKLSVKDIKKKFDNNIVLDGISIDINEGEIVSLIGVSGSGKTTLFNIISGVLQPDSGKVYLNGEDITGRTGKVSYMLQKDLLLPFRTVEDNIALPLLLKGESKKSSREKVSEHLGYFGLKGYEKLYPSKLSGGMKQRAALLRTYLFSKDMALLDEPFSALDTITKAKMWAWYLDIMNSIKLSTLFITHDIDEAIFLSNRVYIMSDKPASIKKIIDIDYDGKRDEKFKLSDAFLRYKRQIVENI